MKNLNKKTEKIVKVKSIFNNDFYYSSESFPTKTIDGELFVGVKKNKNDNETFFMKKDNLEICND
jgi:hypothetical protein